MGTGKVLVADSSPDDRALALTFSGHGREVEAVDSFHGALSRISRQEELSYDAIVIDIFIDRQESKPLRPDNDIESAIFLGLIAAREGIARVIVFTQTDELPAAARAFCAVVNPQGSHNPIPLNINGAQMWIINPLHVRQHPNELSEGASCKNWEAIFSRLSR